MKTHTRILLEALVLHWQSPEDITSEAMTTIDSLLLRPTAALVQRVFDEGHNPDAAGIEQLLFSPDERLQIEMEPHIEKYVWTENDRQELYDALVRQEVRASFCFPDGRGSFSVVMSPYSARAVVDRLRLVRQIDPRVRACLEACVHPALLGRAKVFFRNSRLVWSDARAEFFCLFFEKADFDELLYPLSFIQEFLSELSSGENILEALLRKKRKLFSYMQIARRGAERRRTGTMETIMGAGIRIPYADPHEISRQMNSIDRITRELYGVEEDIDRVIVHEEAALARGDADTVFCLLR